MKAKHPPSSPLIRIFIANPPIVYEIARRRICPL
jgi:hypothetical protein